jgi:hypothetical protein
MFTVEDFLSQYEPYSDQELMGIYSNPEDYSPEAVTAAQTLIDKRGGLEATLKRVRQNQDINDEISRISLEAKALAAKGVDPAFIRQTAMPSKLLSEQQVGEILQTALAEYQVEAEDRAIKPRTVYGSLFGGILASVIGSVLWGGQLILAGGYIDLKITLLLIAGLYFVCYGLIRIATKQSKRNRAVLISTIAAVLISLAVGQALFGAFH